MAELSGGCGGLPACDHLDFLEQRSIAMEFGFRGVLLLSVSPAKLKPTIMHEPNGAYLSTDSVAAPVCSPHGAQRNADYLWIMILLSRMQSRPDKQHNATTLVPRDFVGEITQA